MEIERGRKKQCERDREETELASYNKELILFTSDDDIRDRDRQVFFCLFISDRIKKGEGQGTKDVTLNLC